MVLLSTLSSVPFGLLCVSPTRHLHLQIAGGHLRREGEAVELPRLGDGLPSRCHALCQYFSNTYQDCSSAVESLKAKHGEKASSLLQFQ